MKFLLNVLFGVLAFLLAEFILAKVGLNGVVGWLIAVIIGIAVFLSDQASKVVG